MAMRRAGSATSALSVVFRESSFKKFGIKCGFEWIPIPRLGFCKPSGSPPAARMAIMGYAVILAAGGDPIVAHDDIHLLLPLLSVFFTQYASKTPRLLGKDQGKL
jgi:hypothetical protein